MQLIGQSSAQACTPLTGLSQRDAHACAIHREAMAAALEVVVRENGAAHDGQIGVGADKVMRELRHEIEQAHEAVVRNAHRHMLAVEHDAVLVVISVGRVLQIPLILAERQRHDAVVLARREIHSTCIARVFHAEHAARIAGLLRIFLCGDVTRILFRLGEIDGDLQLAAGRRAEEAHVFGDAVYADIVHVAAELIEIIGGGLRALRSVELFKARAYLRRMRRERAHQLCGKQVAALNAVGKESARGGDVQNRIQNWRSRLRRRRPRRQRRILGRVHVHDLQQPVQRVGAILGGDQLLILGKIQQRVQQRGHALIHAASLQKNISYNNDYPASQGGCQG